MAPPPTKVFNIPAFMVVTFDRREVNRETDCRLLTRAASIAAFRVTQGCSKGFETKSSEVIVMWRLSTPSLHNSSERFAAHLPAPPEDE